MPDTRSPTVAPPPTGTRCGLTAAPHPHRPPAQGREGQPEQREQGDEGADAQQVALVERDGAGRGGDPAREQAAAAGGERDAAGPHVQATHFRAGGGYRQPGQQGVHQLRRRPPAGLRLRGQQQPVRQHRDGDGAHVVRHDERAPAQRRLRPRRAHQLQGGPRRGAQPQVRQPARGRHEVDAVLPHLGPHPDAAHGLDHRLHGAGVGHRCQGVERLGGGVLVEHGSSAAGSG